MMIVMEPQSSPAQIEHVVERLREMGYRTSVTQGERNTLIAALGKGAMGKGAHEYLEVLEALGGVKEILTISEPYKLSNREFHLAETVIRFDNGVAVGGGEPPAIIAGPCSLDRDTEGLFKVAEAVKTSGAKFFRGGAYKPRTSPYDFQGLGEEGLQMLKEIKSRTGLLIVTEIMDTHQLENVVSAADVVQVGARNMQNFDLLKAVGQQHKPVLLKRGLSATIREFLLAAEYIMVEGNLQVILCERGIRSFDGAFTRNVLDLSAIPVLKKLSHLPVIVDPSHATGHRYLVPPMAKAALVCGADGLMVEVHYNPDKALSDGAQSLLIEEYIELSESLKPLYPLRHQIPAAMPDHAP